MNDLLPNPKARNLSAISGAIIVYIWGGASFAEDGSLFGGMVHFEDPSVLEVTALLMFGFSIWSFFLLPPTNPFAPAWEELHKFILADRRLREKVEKIGQQELDSILQEDAPEREDNPRWKRIHNHAAKAPPERAYWSDIGPSSKYWPRTNLNHVKELEWQAFVVAAGGEKRRKECNGYKFSIVLRVGDLILPALRSALLVVSTRPQVLHSLLALSLAVSAIGMLLYEWCRG